MINLSNNGRRFNGMAELYDRSRPAVPIYPVRILSRYLGRSPQRVVDLGCGPGISTRIWQGNCQEAIGIEPNEDMVRAASEKAGPGLKFVRAFGHDTGLEGESADIVVSSQAFHWMEPEATLAEIHRILKKGGIFSTIDYEWPPECGWKTELAFQEFSRAMSALDPEGTKKGIVRWNKKDHLKHIRESGYFIYTRELFFASEESCTASRLVDMALSRSSMQYIARRFPEESQRLIETFRSGLEELVGTQTFEIQLSYRMRMGVKGE